MEMNNICYIDDFDTQEPLDLYFAENADDGCPAEDLDFAENLRASTLQ